MNTISFDLLAPESGNAQISLMDSYGRLILQSKEPYSAGLNSIRLHNLSQIPNGNYLLRIQAGAEVFNRKVIKNDR